MRVCCGELVDSNHKLAQSMGFLRKQSDSTKSHDCDLCWEFSVESTVNNRL